MQQKDVVSIFDHGRVTTNWRNMVNSKGEKERADNAALWNTAGNACPRGKKTIKKNALRPIGQKTGHPFNNIQWKMKVITSA